MASYRTPYNIAIANRQKRLDVANLKNDYENSMDYPLHGGDFWSDFGDGFMSVMKPIGQIASVVAPFLGAGESGGMYDKTKYHRMPNGQIMANSAMGMGYSGGMTYEQNMNMADAMGDIFSGEGQSGGRMRRMRGGDMSVNAPYEGYVYGSGMSGGAIANQGQPPFNVSTNAGMSGGDIADWLGNLGKLGEDTIMPEPPLSEQQAAPFLKLLGKGQSGGDFWSDLGNVATQVAPFLPLLGLGESGGGLSGGDEVIDTQPAVYQNPELQATAFLGGRHPRSVPKKEKMRLLKKAVADMLLQKQLMTIHGKGKLRGSGMSGGDFDWSSLASLAPLLLGLGLSGGDDNSDMDLVEPLVMGLGLSGGDFWSDLGDTFSKVAPFLPLLGLGQSGGGSSGGGSSGGGLSGGNLASSSRINSGNNQLYKGGNRNLANMPYLGGAIEGEGFFDDLKDGFDKVMGVVDKVKPYVDTGLKVFEMVKKVKGGKKKKQTKQDKMNERLAMKISHLQGKGIEPVSSIEESNDKVVGMSVNNPEVDRKVGGKKTSKWIEHVKNYSKQHGINYSQALKQAKATYRG